MVAKVRVYGINWDLDVADYTDEELQEISLDLPDEVTLTIPDFDELTMEDYVNDYLAEKYGFCVWGWDYEILRTDTDVNLDTFLDDMETGILDDDEEDF